MGLTLVAIQYMAKTYDFNKAREILRQHTSQTQSIVSAELGMAEDWGWTAQEIWADGKCTLPDEPTGEIAGISGSAWATPTLKIILTNGTSDTYDCYQDADSDITAEEIENMKNFARITGGMDSVN